MYGMDVWYMGIGTLYNIQYTIYHCGALSEALLK